MASIEISLVTAILGGILGFLMAYAVISGGLPSPFRSGLMTFSGVASNFAGIPLALAFTFTLGRVGFLTIFLQQIMGVNIYANGFTIYSKIVFRGAGLIFFAYIGFDAVSTASQEARNPGRDIPIGILASLAICTVIYIAVGVVMTGLVPYAKLNVASPIAVAVEATGLTWLAPIINIGALCGLSSVILVNMLAQSRIFYSMSRDGLLPPLFARLHPRFRTPHVTTAITGIVVAIASGLFPITVLGLLVSMGTLLAFAIVCTGVLILRKTAPDTPRPFKTPGMPWVPVVGTLICIYLMTGLPLPTWIRLFVWLAVGLTIYFSYGRFRAATVRDQAIADAA